jgi:uncharacterized protein
MDFADLNEAFFDTALVLKSHGDRWRAIGVNIRGVIAIIFARRGRRQHHQRASGQQERKGVL